ncbi:TPA: hypothetical protein LLS51_000051 [Serratia marcescens]|nr:hypothetical protein [Serratia marcescens]HBK4670735.1 hypothetical protein [Serratia marcescens]
MIEIIVQELTKQIYTDIKNCAPQLIKKLKIPLRLKKTNAPRFKTPWSLQDALKSNKIKNNSWVVLECKPSSFGPYLRSHILSPIFGNNTEMRRGPALWSDNPVLGIISQSMSYLKPVGLYPPLTDELSQIILYPSDATACGFISMFPGVNNLISGIQAITRIENTNCLNSPSLVTGIVRMITPAMFSESNIPLEIYEDFRQSGDIWFLDVFSEGTEIRPLHDGVVTEFWGGLYASGHIEFEGQLYANPVIEGIYECFKENGFSPEHTQNYVATKEVILFDKGIRCVLYPQTSLYSLHMDTNLTSEYKENRTKFDSMCNGILKVIDDVTKKSGVDLKNPYDLDFSYTDSAKSFSVMKSEAASKISDPIAISIRDWHRKKNK